MPGNVERKPPALGDIVLVYIKTIRGTDLLNPDGFYPAMVVKQATPETPSPMEIPGLKVLLFNDEVSLRNAQFDISEPPEPGTWRWRS